MNEQTYLESTASLNYKLYGYIKNLWLISLKKQKQLCLVGRKTLRDKHCYFSELSK